MGRVQGKSILVTGAASGIGYEIAERLVAEGARVVLADLRTEMAMAAAAQLGDAAWGAALDVRDDASWVDLMLQAAGRFGQLDAMVNNAGIAATPQPQDVENVALTDWRAVQAVNVEGVLLGCQHAIRALQSTGGSIVNISSVAALMGTPTLAAYGASKAAVTQLTKTVALHCARRGYRIRCNSVHPGLVATGLFEATFSAAEQAEKLQSIPMGQFAKPEEVAAMVLYLVSDESTHVTGARFVIDGGMTMV
ncbi:MAG: glucose 1-dehydrogenase [Gammaproteobacteria bacterium]|nr:glucose 1-dehydrogenase [Gammaproteobacteria bacterium]